MSTLLALLVACASPPAEEEVLDARLSAEDVPAAAADQLLWWGPDVEIQPYSDETWCLFGTWDQPDAALTAVDMWQSEYGHHIVLMGTTVSELDFPDGAVANCTDPDDAAMTSLEPLINPRSLNGEIYAETDLPEGMAFKLREGQRWVLQSHVINPYDTPMRAQDAVLLSFMPMEEVTTWTSMLAVNNESFSIPSMETASSTLTCELDQDYSMLFVLGHMHEWGDAIQFTHIRGEERTLLYDVPVWDPVMRDAPPIVGFGDAPLQLLAGDKLELTCTWTNDEDHALEFPYEMCTGVGMVYPALTPEICSR